MHFTCINVAIHLKVHLRSLSLRKSHKHRRALQHVDVIVSSRHSEESMSNPEVLICNHFKDHTALPGMSLIQSLPSKRHFFQPQCMQPMLPSIPGNPLAVFCAKILAVSSVGSQVVHAKRCHRRPKKSAHGFRACGFFYA
jgi:hypothetical protein